MMIITKNLYIFWDSEGYNENEDAFTGRYILFDYDVSKYNPSLKLLCVHTRQFEVPEVDKKGCLVESLERQLKEINDKAVAAAQPIKDKLQQLLALDAPL